MQKHHLFIVFFFSACSFAMEKKSEAEYIKQMLRKNPEISEQLTNGLDDEKNGDFAYAAESYKRAAESKDLRIQGYATILLKEVNSKIRRQERLANNSAQ